MKKITFFFFFLSLASCENAQKKAVEALQTELLNQHDEVMVKTMRMDKLKNEMLTVSEANPHNDSLKILIIDTSLKLQTASDDMFKWMDNLGVAMNETTDLKQKLELYNELLPEIKRIATETNEYSEKAKAIIGS